MKGKKHSNRSCATDRRLQKYLSKTTFYIELFESFSSAPECTSALMSSFFLLGFVILLYYLLAFVCASTLCVYVICIPRHREKKKKREKKQQVVLKATIITRPSDLRVHRRPLRVVNIVFSLGIFSPRFFFILVFFLLLSSLFSVSSQMLKKQERQHKKKTFTLKGKKKGNTTITQSARIHTARERKKGTPEFPSSSIVEFC